MQYLKERITVIVVQSGLVFLVFLIPMLFPKVGANWFVNLLLFTIILCSTLIAYFYSYKALLPSSSTKKLLSIGYLSMLFIWVYCTLIIWVLITTEAHISCLKHLNTYTQCYGSIEQSSMFTFELFFISFIFALPSCFLGSIISYITRYMYEKLRRSG